MKINKYVLGLVAGASLLTVSCSDFLDTAPDTRTEINTVESVRQLLATAYTQFNYGLIAELSSDNVVDNNAPHVSNMTNNTVYYSLNAADRMSDELFAFEPVVTNSGNDTPNNIWMGFYNAIATVNHALENLDRIETEQTLSASDRALASACRGEAYLSRAYHHFILVNMFSQAYRSDELSMSDVGIPYVTVPEKDLLQHYDRGTVTETYRMIEQDLQEGLKRVNDSYYAVPKYHFNRNAAYAFAARFYLFKHEYDSVIKYANLVLGDTPGEVSGLLRDYTQFKDRNLVDDAINVWIDNDSPANLLLMPTYSAAMRYFSSGYRYALNHEAAAGSLNGFGPSWLLNIHPTFMGAGLLHNGIQDYGLMSLKLGEKFRIMNKVANTGYAIIVRMEFTTDLLLLERAEAYIMKFDLPSALADLHAWDQNLQNGPVDNSAYFVELTNEAILSFYASDNEDAASSLLDYSNVDKMIPGHKIYSGDMEAYMNCLMHFRRLETIHTGMRFFDLKRLGIEYSHEIGKAQGVMEPERVEFLYWNDPRRALEVPQESIIMGLEPSRQAPSTDVSPSSSVLKMDDLEGIEVVDKNK